jgi:hypothetical protein
VPNSKARLSDFDLESKVAGFVRSYIRVSRGGDSSEEQEALRWAYAGLERLLGELLQGSKGWTGWVDGILPATDMFPDALKVISPVELTVRGCAIWGERSQGPFWIEPFLGSVRISENTDAILGYSLKFGDATRGLATVPYGKHLRRPDWFFPVEWLFAFSKGAVEGEISQPA